MKFKLFTKVMMVGIAPGEEEEGVRVLEFQEPEVGGEGGQAPALKIKNRT